MSSIKLKRNTEVYHVFGTSEQEKHRGKSWLIYWYLMTKVESPVRCCIIDGSGDRCEKKARDGAHVQVGGSRAEAIGTAWYVIPTCRGHNSGQNGKVMSVCAISAAPAEETILEKIQSLGYEPEVKTVCNAIKKFMREFE